MPAPAIYVDADACPVKAEVEKVAERLGVVVTYVSNGGLRPSRDPMIRNVVVSKGADAADDWIVENAKSNDIVITADIPLAARAVALGAHVYWMDGDAVDAETKKKIPVGGLLFPGDKRPEGWDFLYFSAVIGMRSALPPATLGRARPS